MQRRRSAGHLATILQLLLRLLYRVDVHPLVASPAPRYAGSICCFWLLPRDSDNTVQTDTPSVSPQATSPGTIAKLRILFTSDIHSHLLGYDYFSDTPAPSKGLCRASHLIESLKLADHCCLLLDGGDSLQGTPMADWASEQHRLDPTNPIPPVQAMNAMSYDAAALGNHDLGNGLGFLKSAIAQSNFPWLCANVFEKTSPRRPIALPTTLLIRTLPGVPADKANLRIGLFGVMPPQVTEWEASRLNGHVTSCSIVEAARNAAAELRTAGADLVVAISHSGISEAEDFEENASVLVAEISDVDVVLCGHTHQVFPGPGFNPSEKIDPIDGTLCGKPAVMPGHHGSHVGVIDLDLVQDRGLWSIAAHKAQCLRPNVDSHDAPHLKKLLLPAHTSTLSYIRRPVGHLPHHLHSFFSAVMNDKALQLVAEAQRRFVEEAIAGSPYEYLPILSAAAPLKAGGRAGADNYADVLAGEICNSGISDLYCFSNEIAAICVDGTGLCDWLEMAAGRYRQLFPGQPDQDLLDPDFSAYNGDVLHGLTYKLDVTRPAQFSARGARVHAKCGRITDLRYQNKPVTKDQMFVVATNSYRAHGGGRFPGLANAEQIPLPQRDIRAILSEHVKRGNDIYGTAPPAWCFAAAPGFSAEFDTSPKASPLIHMTNPLSLTIVGPAKDGSLRMRLDL